MAKQIIKSYFIGDIAVKITGTGKKDKLHVDCNDGTYHSSFTVSQYEYENYTRHMNQRIKDAYKQQYEEEE